VWDRITAICSIVVAAAALAVAIWQGIEMRRHQRLSLRPSRVYLYNQNPHIGPLGVSISDAGLAPAFIDSIISVR
jgi:hypothetical protein